MLTVTEQPSAEGFIDCDQDELRERFNRSSFEFAHHLSGHPLFQIPRLIALAQYLDPRGSVYYDAGDIRVDQRWDHSPSGKWPVAETIRRIREAGAWIILRSAEQDPEYGALLNECMAEIQRRLGRDLTKEMKVQDAIIFITSPRRVTAYHIDRECNFILQIQGEKDISVFDQTDREVLTDEEIERFWMVDNNSAIYKEQFQSRARVYHMAAGKAIHVPVNAPHWVKNGDDISVTLSVNFQFRENFPAHVYRANYLLRKLGVSPIPPGKSKMRDTLKMLAMNITYVPARAALRASRKLGL